MHAATQTAQNADGRWLNLRLVPELFTADVALADQQFACIVVQQGRMVWVGPQDAVPAQYQSLPAHDGKGQLATPGLSGGDIVEAGKQLSAINDEIEQLEERWLELSEQVESISAQV